MDTIQDWVASGVAVGRSQAFAVIASKCSAAQATTLKQVKESGCYTSLGFTWDEFCPEYFGISRATADRVIGQLNEFGESYFRLAQLARISPDDYRRIAAKVTPETIEFESQSIPLTPENAPRIRAAVQSLRAELRRAEAAYVPSSIGIIELQTRLDTLLEETARLNKPLLPASERNVLRGLTEYAIHKWTALARKISQQP